MTTDIRLLEPPAVQRIRTEDGSHVEPPLQTGWSESEKMAWLAAVVAADTGLTVDAIEHPTGYTFRIGKHRPSRHADCLVVGARSSGGPWPYDIAWIYLTAVSLGARCALAGPED